MATQAPYPARLEGRLDPDLSRWLWLVKWFLAIPHFIVLAFLWIACSVVWLIALFAILFTERYPRGLFDFTVGVIRWTWRVLYYAFSTLATDRYPPFSLQDDPGYPASFHVDYPERLSRGLVLVKWWLLAIPHYFVLGAVVGTVYYNVSDEYIAGMSLMGALALIVGGGLLFTGRYLPDLFPLLMGLNRWVYRVIAYVSLLTDRYPPFRLEMGGADPEGRPA